MEGLGSTQSPLRTGQNAAAAPATKQEGHASAQGRRTGGRGASPVGFTALGTSPGRALRAAAGPESA